MDQKKIGNFLRELRKNRGFTQEQAAEKLGISSRTISRWETGAYMPDISMLIDIADGERKEENMNSEVKEVAEKMVDYSMMEKNNIFNWFRLMGIGTMIISLCLILLNCIRPFAIHDMMPIFEWRILLANMISPYALLMYVMFAFSIVVIVFTTKRFRSVGQSSRTFRLTKLIIIIAITLAFVSVLESVFIILLHFH